MKRLLEGFLLIEVLISFLLITMFVIICMRFYVQSLTLKEQSLFWIDAVNQLQEKLDQFQKDKQVDYSANRKYKLTHTIKPITIPVIRGNPVNLSLKTIQRMKHMTMMLTWESYLGTQHCSLPLIFKDNHEMY